MSASTTFRNYEERLQRVLSHIYENLDGELSLDALADIACMSRYHWHRVFKAMTGETLAEAVRRLRLHKAANALVHEETPVSEIAKRVGYPNLASFSRAFSNAHGMSPNAFREQGVEITELLQRNSGDQKMYPVVIKDIGTFQAAGIEHVGPYEDIGGAFQKLGGVMAARSLMEHITGAFGIYYDAPDSKPEAELRSCAAFMTGYGFPKDVEGLDYFEVAGGKYAVMEHKGPYATLGAAYDWLYGKWLPESGEEPRDAPPVEIYVNDPATTAPADLRTDICLPIA
ncbi:MAG: AraC family transcriptional regulator [Filomicrobium sp.]